MLPEVAANRKAWGLLAQDHYQHFRRALSERRSLLNRIVTAELGDIAGRKLIHLQCNTGADTISLARLGATVTGVDLVPDNVKYARLLAADCGVDGARFIEADLMQFGEVHGEQYDIVFTSEGALCWLPDLQIWANTVRKLLREDGFFYVFDGHPFYQVFDENKLPAGELSLRYPYFSRVPDRGDEIGGYAAERRTGENYCWNYTAGDVINSLIRAGLQIEYFHEFDVLFYDQGGMQQVEPGLFRDERFAGILPATFSLKATVRPT